MTEDEIAQLKRWAISLLVRATDWNNPNVSLRAWLFIAWVATLVVTFSGWIICLLSRGKVATHRGQWFHTLEWSVIAWPVLIVAACLASIVLGRANRVVLRARGKHKVLTSGQRDRLINELEPMLREIER